MISKLMPFFILSVFLLSGCGLKQPTPAELTSADYGTFPESYEQIVKDYMEKKLFDPYSAHFDFNGSPNKGWQNSYGSFLYGWKGTVSINAKNRMGGYVGTKDYNYLIKNDMVYYMQEKWGY